LVASPDAREYPFVFGVGIFFANPKNERLERRRETNPKKSLMFAAPNF
jgi:hypothetical protein